MISILDGPGGLGKTACALDLAARVTTGRPWPLEPDSVKRAPRDVVLLGSEDSPAHTTRPRLDAFGADSSRVHLIDSVGGSTPKFPDDLDAIEKVIRDTNAAMLLIDPITGFLGGADMHRDNEVRNALMPLAAVAERTGCAVLMLRHVKKSGNTEALNRGLGSVAFTNVARCLMMLLRDPSGPTGNRRVLCWPKMNIAAEPKSLQWKYQQKAGQKMPAIAWDSTVCDLSADEILRGQDAVNAGKGSSVTRVEEAEEMIKTELNNRGEMPSRELEELVKARGHSTAAYKRAKTKVGTKSRKDSAGAWHVSLPGKQGAQVPQHKKDETLALLAPLPPQGAQESQGAQLPRPRESEPLGSWWAFTLPDGIEDEPVMQ